MYLIKLHFISLVLLSNINSKGIFIKILAKTFSYIKI